MAKLYTSTQGKRVGALLLTVCMLSVWLLGARAALSSSIYSVQHACCHQEKLADSCRTLCSSASWTATASVEQAPLVPALRVVWISVHPPVPRPSELVVKISAFTHSPPLYLQHSSLLI